MGYIKQLDSVRAIAVILVLFWHWIPRNSFINQFQTGPFGVAVFFVLSGFLITKILMENRNRAENLGNKKSMVLKNFYFRRTLRIFPIYYLTIVLVIILYKPLGLHYSLPEFFSNISYTSNFYLICHTYWPDLTPHFWSLSVEEQFYLFWPLIILFIHKNYLLHGIMFFILTGAVSQFFVSDLEFGFLWTHTCFDALGMGALLAWMTVYRPSFLRKAFLIISIMAAAAVIIIVLEIIGLRFFHQWRLLHSIIGAWVICYIIRFRETRSWLTILLSNRLLIWIGKISYGIYLYHVLYFYVFWKLFSIYIFPLWSHLDPSLIPWLFLLVNVWILFFFCWLSWIVIEKPLLGFKRKFRYQD